MRCKRYGFVWQTLRFVGYSERALLHEVNLNLCKVFWLIVLGIPFVAVVRYGLWVFTQNPDFESGTARRVRWWVAIPRIALTVGAVLGFVALTNPKAVGTWALAFAMVTAVVLIAAGINYIAGAVSRSTRTDKPSREFEMFRVIAVRTKALKDKICPAITFLDVSTREG